MLGLRKGTVRLVPHAEAWHQMFDQEAGRIRAAVGGLAAAVEHVGSTAVCGISAKPVIDIAVAVRELADAARCVAPLEGLGYEYRGENGIPGRHYFTMGEPRTHHLHVVELGGEFWRGHLLFRDHLRRHPHAAKEYDDLKQKLAREHPEDRAAYTDGKAAFITGVIKAAGGVASG
ncbi:MAG TPA: GrpB family protein [Pyrinomonadaceae bacterium]